MVRVTKSVAMQRLGDVAEDRQFWCQNGQIFRNLEDMEIGWVADELARCGKLPE